MCMYKGPVLWATLSMNSVVMSRGLMSYSMDNQKSKRLLFFTGRAVQGWNNEYYTLTCSLCLCKLTTGC